MSPTEASKNSPSRISPVAGLRPRMSARAIPDGSGGGADRRLTLELLLYAASATGRLHRQRPELRLHRRRQILGPLRCRQRLVVRHGFLERAAGAGHVALGLIDVG